eukprot:CAMPEP_0119370208 /NCGR_PEP_ID=MMETSP1334-20130426/16600_1 /TAXON_ID=127549 /ORGANISM="Calcidiscus leptoporus, Strain RCC1130" /LENGTH=76 /DNA_ID=CAMNT_0007387223 /DNA_START=468 /DNA_END=698 /DNA_ORIENTATION=-
MASAVVRWCCRAEPHAVVHAAVLKDEPIRMRDRMKPMMKPCSSTKTVTRHGEKACDKDSTARSGFTRPPPRLRSKM